MDGNDEARHVNHGRDKQAGLKEQLKLFIKHRVGVRGDKVFWGKLLWERGQGDRQEGGGGQGGGGGPTGREGDDVNIPPEEEFEDNTATGGGPVDDAVPGGGREEEITPGEDFEEERLQEVELEAQSQQIKVRSSTQTKYSWVGRLQKPEETLK